MGWSFLVREECVWGEDEKKTSMRKTKNPVG
jgi:hypothetical protein